MLKFVRFVCQILCLLCLSSFGQSGVNCGDFNVTNCGSFNCIVDTVGGTLTCKDDSCFANTPPCTGLCITVGPVCASVENHFSNCRLTGDALDAMHGGDDTKFPAMEKYCDDQGCGGLYAYYDKNDDIYFQCEEPGNDGTEGPDDFDVANCKHFQYKVVGGKCDWDPCSYGIVGVNCTGDASCAELTVDGGGLCLNKDQTKCGASSWNLPALTSSDNCTTMGCGGLDVAKSKRGVTYLFCKPAPPANNDGTEVPDDFDVANCKHFQYKPAGGKCDWDPCSKLTVGVNCTDDASCSELTVENVGDLCLNKDQTKCGAASWNLPTLTSSDNCATMGCGGLDVAKSKKGNIYLFCKPPAELPPECLEKSSGLYLHVHIFVILIIAISAFL